MKQSIFIVSLFFVAFAIALGIFLLVFGDPSNFKDGAGREVPLNLLGTIYTGGPLVSLLITLSIMDVAIIVERVLSLKKAAGKKAVPKFFAQVLEDVKAGRIDEGLAA